MSTDIDPDRAMPRALAKIADLRGMRLLEAGAGDGRLTLQYASQARSVIGIDVKGAEVRAAVSAIRDRVAGAVEFLCASATALPFAAGQFDVVFLASSL